MDIPFCYLILSSMTAVLFSLHTEDLLSSSNLTAVVRARPAPPRVLASIAVRAA